MRISTVNRFIGNSPRMRRLRRGEHLEKLECADRALAHISLLTGHLLKFVLVNTNITSCPSHGIPTIRKFVHDDAVILRDFCVNTLWREIFSYIDSGPQVFAESHFLPDPKLRPPSKGTNSKAHCDDSLDTGSLLALTDQSNDLTSKFLKIVTDRIVLTVASRNLRCRPLQTLNQWLVVSALGVDNYGHLQPP